ncbi:LOW QUALITY PROTEIN: membrane protein FAM174B [Ursus americanus]|uniref:LOW QUALITY PROTEIN: membrane protein FAM174B n=1 Tax=Ursus americanus TaxID=9643 RepID=UPI001E67B463|nr:LOW QUALITY PROTEIN: membrane protein FAM174B [Ursus americanus]
MRAAPPPGPLLPLLLLLALLAAPAARARRAESAPAPPQPEPERPPRPSPGPGPGNATRTGSEAPAGGGGSSNSSGDALVTRISSLLRDLPTLKAAVIVACAFTALLIACLLLRVFRWGKRSKRPASYDIITTPAERVEMAPLNEEDDEDEDSTVFDIKYRDRGKIYFQHVGILWNTGQLQSAV